MDGNHTGEGGKCYNSSQLKLARTGSKVLPIRQRIEDGTSGVDTLEREVVTAPVDLDTLLLQGEESDQGGNSDATGESSGGDAEKHFISMMFAI